jgi:16S rRNA (adenine1518-N6/adenine1519-N6)-dimethyltransferase
MDFYPIPKIKSTVINILPREIPAAFPKNEELMYKIIEASFGQRRKTLVNALSSVLNLDKQNISDIVEHVTKNKNIRGETLDIKAFSDISDLILNFTIY